MAAKQQWKEGALCELYIRDKWIDGEIIRVFEDDEGKCVRVKYGQRIIDLDPNDDRIRQRGHKNLTTHWKEGALCELYVDDNWVNGEIIHVFVDMGRTWIRVKHGRRNTDAAPNDARIRQRGFADSHVHINQLKRGLTLLDAKTAAIVTNSLDQPHQQQLMGQYTISKQRTRFNVTQCIVNELFPTMSAVISQCIQEKNEKELDFENKDLGAEAIKDVLERLKEKRTMSSKEIQYLGALIQRAAEHEYDVAMLDHDIGAVEYKFMDISPKWPGLTVDLLFDIFGVHKALIFGQQQRAEYPHSQFMKDLGTAEHHFFGEDTFSIALSDDDPRFLLSFYPLYLINDDIFEVMACHFAVSMVANKMQHEFCMRSVVIPAGICSRYDIDDEYTPTIRNISLFLRRASVSNLHVTADIQPHIEHVQELTDLIMKMVTFIRRDETRNIAVIFNRQRALKDDPHTVTVFECSDWSELVKMQTNYYLSIDFNVSADEKTRCWLTFGKGQQLRFYPEHAVWIIPRLLVRSTAMSAYEMVAELYSEHYKHGWRVSLDDPIFNKYYHIITGHEHVSNNYNRKEVKVMQHYVDPLLLDHLQLKLNAVALEQLVPYVQDQLYDTDSILEDILGSGSTIFEGDSNIATKLGSGTTVFRALKFEILKFRDIECREGRERDYEECHYIDCLIRNLEEFQKCHHIIDALSVVDFVLDDLIQAFDHLISVHKFSSDAAKREEIQNFVAERIQCERGDECQMLKMHAERARERSSAESMDEPLDEVETLCEVVSDAICAVHCYVLHEDQHLYRLYMKTDMDMDTRFSTVDDDDDEKQSQSDSDKKEEVSGELVGLNFGENVLTWLPFGEKPTFNSLNHEIVHHTESTVEERTMSILMMTCSAKIKNTKCTLNEMVCLKLYSDFTKMQSMLRKVFWKGVPIKVRKGHYHWAMGLYRAHLYHAKPIPVAKGSASKPCRLFHGLNRLFTISNELPVYFGPFSTTIAKNVATRFSEQKGLLFTIQPSYNNPFKFCIGIEMNTISCFQHENEILLFNQLIPIQKTDTYDEDSQILVDLLMYTLQRQASPIIDQTTFYKKLGVKFDASWTPLIVEHKLLFQNSKFDEKRIIERLYGELNIDFFAFLDSIHDEIILDGNHTVTLKKRDSDEHSKVVHLSDYAFALQFGSVYESQGTESLFEFNDYQEFSMSTQPAVESVGESLNLNLYCKPKDDSFNASKIKSFVLPRYEFTNKNALVIGESLTIPRFDSVIGLSGNLLIKSTSDVIIGHDVKLEGWEAMTKSNKRGGIIQIISEGTVINKGTLMCHESEAVSMGTIVIVARKFVNEGVISCKPRGKIQIFSQELNAQNKNGKQTLGGVWDAKLEHVSVDDNVLPIVDYFMFLLQSHPSRITNKDAFYERFGVQLISDWFQQIVSHKKLFERTLTPDGERVVDRLAEELESSFFEVFSLIHNVFVVKDDTVTLTLEAQSGKTGSNVRIQDYLFAVSNEMSLPDEDVDDYGIPSYRFQTIDELSIPIADTLSTKNTIYIFCKSMEAGSRYIQIARLEPRVIAYDGRNITFEQFTELLQEQPGTLHIANHGKHTWWFRDGMTHAMSEFQVSFEETHTLLRLLDDHLEFSAYYAVIAVLFEMEISHFVKYGFRGEWTERNDPKHKKRDHIKLSIPRDPRGGVSVRTLKLLIRRRILFKLQTTDGNY